MAGIGQVSEPEGASFRSQSLEVPIDPIISILFIAE